MSACADHKPDIQTVVDVHNVYPVIPANFLNCTAEPVPGQILTDIQAAQFTESVRVAGLDCRQRLGKVRDAVAAWPK